MPMLNGRQKPFVGRLNQWSRRMFVTGLVLNVLGFCGPLVIDSWGCSVRMYFLLDLPHYVPLVVIALLVLYMGHPRRPNRGAGTRFCGVLLLGVLGLSGYLLHLRLFHPQFHQPWYKFLLDWHNLDSEMRLAIGFGTSLWWVVLGFFVSSWLQYHSQPQILWLRLGIIVGCQGLFLHIVTLSGYGPTPTGLAVYVGTFLVLFSLVGLELTQTQQQPSHFLSNHRRTIPDTESTL